MANKDYTHISIVVDRSGSMTSYGRSIEAQNGINNLIKEHTDGGKVTVRLSEFDDHHNIVEDCVRIEDVKPYHLRPRGMTSLRDAIGLSIQGTNKYITKMGLGRRPGLVLFIVVTDGGENNSTEFSPEMIKEMVGSSKEKGWEFTFMGADLTTVLNAKGWGFDSSNQYDLSKSKEVYGATSGKFMRMRTMKSQGLAVDNSFTDQELGMFEIK
jgi:uncharacterized protein YegL